MIHSAVMDPYDRVLHTAADRPETAELPTLADPAADHAPDLDPLSRRHDVEVKHRQIVALLDATGADAAVLAHSDSIAWFTAGGDLSGNLAADDRAAALVYVTRASRAVVCDNVQSPRIFEEELPGLGFQVKERSWHDDPSRMLQELGHGKLVLADAHLPGCRFEGARLSRLQLRLTRRERQVFRELGRSLSLAVEATCRNFMPGETEAAVAGHLAHRLIREGITPVELRVASDDRLDRYRQPRFTSSPIRRRAIIAVVGRRQGLCAGLTRTVCFGPVPAPVRKAHELAAMVDATCLFFSRPGEPVTEVFRRAKRIYAKFGRPDEWTLDYQGGLIGYAPSEGRFTPDSPLVLESDMAVRWNPSVQSARSEDTVVVDARGYEVVTQAQAWPQLEITVKGVVMTRPGLLERPANG
jgi:Xaa-Pro aminopeptidase